MGNNKVFCILGKFASGKTTVAKLLQDGYGLNRAITCTTRAKREGECEGKDYYFVSDEEFETLASEGKLIAINRITTQQSVEQPSVIHKLKNIFKSSSTVVYSKKYGLPVQKLNLDECSYICVLEPSGYYDLIDKLGKDNVKSIYLRLNDKERFLRALNREINPDINGIIDKYLEEFALYDSIEDDCDKIINNVGSSDDAATQIYEYIQEVIGDTK